MAAGKKYVTIADASGKETVISDGNEKWPRVSKALAQGGSEPQTAPAKPLSPKAIAQKKPADLTTRAGMAKTLGSMGYTASDYKTQPKMQDKGEVGVTLPALPRPLQAVVTLKAGKWSLDPIDTETPQSIGQSEALDKFKADLAGLTAPPAKPTPAATPQAPVDTKAAPAEPDYLTQLFGTPEQQAESQSRYMAGLESERQGKEVERANVERVQSSIAAEKTRAKAEHDEWAAKVYKANKTQVELRGDGPSKQESMSIGAINESRRRNAMEALAQELSALDRLDAAMKADGGRVMANLHDLMQKAERAVASGNWPNDTADSLFQSMLLDDLKFRGHGGKGSVTSNGLSKALLAAIKKDESKPALTETAARVRDTLKGAEPVAPAVKPPEQQTEAEFGAVEKVRAIARAEQDLADAKAGKVTVGKFSEYKSKAGAIIGTRKQLEAVQAAAPEKFAADHLAAVNRAVREGKAPSAENIARYQLPADLTAYATHKDPGEPAEVVTPAVVKDAIKTALRTVDRKPSEMKTELLAKVDAAITNAKADKADQIERSEAARNDGTSYVTFDVPGDGVFKVMNARDKLTEFRAKVESSPGFRDRQARAGLNERATDTLARRSTDAAIANMLDEGDFRAALDFAEAKDVDIANVKLTKVLRERLDKWERDTKMAAAVAEFESRKPAEAAPLEMSKDGIAGREVSWGSVPNGNEAFQYAIGKTEKDIREAIYRRRADERGTYGGWRWEADAPKGAQKTPAPETSTSEPTTTTAEPATEAAAILDAAKITGKDRIDAIKDVKAGTITTDELKDAYPAAEAKPVRDKIEDFGAKLEGARKDYAAVLKDAETVDIAAEPLSKSWPEPGYQKMLDGGAEPYMVAFTRAARDELPTKPQKAWKLKGWVQKVEMLRGLSQKLLSGVVTPARLREMLASKEWQLLRDTVGNRAELYEMFGHDRSLKGITFAENRYGLYKGQQNVTKWVVEQKAKATMFSNWPRELAVGDSKAEMLENFKAKIATLDTGPKAKGQAQFVVYLKRGQTGAFVGKKIGREYIDLHKVDDVTAARKYMQDNAADLEKALEAYKQTPFERKTENQPRVGDDHRNGAPATPDVFAETFGFRGVQFGNYVEQGRRQSDLNQAFDGLMDMAAVLGIPPRSISLNGKLGLAFGARGKGGTNAPAAHYEPGNVVINLTKGSGPGSLAHEWWHSLDNYFGKESGAGGYGTGGVLGDKTRAEMKAAFEEVKKATQAKTLRQRAAELDKRKSKPYWDTPIELSARSFEMYVIAKLHDQGAANDYLANVVSKEFWDAQEALRAGMLTETKTSPTFPYPIGDEMPAVRAAFDDFFKTIQTRTDEAGNVAMFSRETAAPTRATASDITRVTNTAEGIAAAWANKTDIVVFGDMQDDAVPENVRARDAQQRSQGATGEPRAFYAGGKVYLHAGMLKTPMDVAEALYHESLGHAGLRGHFGPALDKVLDQMAALYNQAVMQAKAIEYGQAVTDKDGKFVRYVSLQARRTTAEEVLAEMAQTRPSSTWVQKAIAAIRAFLRDHVPGFADLKLTDADVIARFLVPARGFIERGRGAAGSEGAVFQRGTGESALQDLSRVSTKMAQMGYEPDRVANLQAGRKLAGLVKRLEDGTMSEGLFTISVKGLAEQMADVSATKAANRLMSDRVRGADVVRERLIRARRQGDIDHDAVEFALWALDKNPALAENLGISVRAPKDGGAAGDYNPASEVIRIFKGSENDYVAVHEIMHHAERMMPPDMQAAIRREWSAALAKAIKRGTPDQVAALRKIANVLAGDRSAYEALTTAILQGPLNYDEHYQLINPSEYWAVNSARLLGNRWKAQGYVWQRIGIWLDEMVSKIKGLLRLRSDAPILKALDAVMAGDGSRQSKVMLSDLRALLTTDGVLPDIKASRTDQPDSMRDKAAGGMAMFSRTPTDDIGLAYPGVVPPGNGQPTLGSDDGGRWPALEQSKMASFIYRMQDKHVDLKDVQKAIKATLGQVRDEINAYQKEELFHGRAAQRVEAFLDGELNPLIEAMRARKVTQEDLGKFLWAKHAREANKHIASINPDNPDMQDGGSGMTNEDAASHLAGLSDQDRATYEALAARVYAMTAATRAQLVADGLLSDADKATWERAYRFYVPLNREDMDTMAHGNGTGQGFSIRGKESKRRVGSERAVTDIIANIANQRDRAVVRGEKNRVAMALYGLAKESPNPEFWNTDSPPILRVVETVGGQDQVVERIDPLYKSKDNVVMVKIANPATGAIEEHSILFNERNERAVRMAASIKNLDGSQLGELLGTTAKVTRYFAAINTQYNPIFGVVNLIRDVQGAMLNLTNTPLAGKQGKILADTWAILRGSAKHGMRGFAGEWAALAKEFEAAGGQTAYRDMFRTGKERSESIQKALDPEWWTKTAWGKTITANGYLERPMALLLDKGAKPILSWLTDYNSTMENAVRLAAFKEARAANLSVEQAASLAKNLTVNFNRKGEMAMQAGALYAFFNASVQGMARMAQALTGPAGKRIIYGGITLGAMQALLLAAAGFDDDEPPDFVRERNLILPIGNKKYLTLPMPLGFNVLPNIGRLTMETLLSGGKNPWKKVESMIGVLADATNPLGGSAPIAQIISPTITDPLIALGMNKDWTGKPIAREDMSGLNPTPGFTRSRDVASAPAKWLAEAINTTSGGSKYKPGIASPTADQIEYLIGQVTGGVGRELGKVATVVETTATGDELPPYKVPLLGRFYGSSEGQAAQGQSFYANLKEMNGHEATIKGLRKDGRGADAAEYLRENPEARLIRLANETERIVSKLRKRKRDMQERGAAPVAVKTIDAMITLRMKALNDAVRQGAQ